jgi:hypothetical protein
VFAQPTSDGGTISHSQDTAVHSDSGLAVRRTVVIRAAWLVVAAWLVIGVGGKLAWLGYVMAGLTLGRFAFYAASRARTHFA